MDMNNLLEQMRAAQEQIEKIQNELMNITITAESGGGMVKVTMNGQQRLLSISIDKEVIDPNEKEMLEDLIVAAVNRGADRSREASESRMADAARAAFPGMPPLQ